MSKPIQVQTAETVFDVVRALAEEGALGLDELVAHLDLPRSTVHDHIRSLESIGMVIQEDGRYRASLRFLELGERMRHQRELYRAGHSEAKQLTREYGEHAGLIIEENGQAVVLYVTSPPEAVELGARDGMHVGLHSHAAGKAILAHLPQERRDEIIDEHGLPAYTPQTITDRETLIDELDTIRERGYATMNGELMEGVRAVAAPIISGGETRGAIALGGPKQRMRGERFQDELPKAVLQASNVVELNLSYG